jgi:YesN/AraC family two-component response regulator
MASGTGALKKPYRLRVLVADDSKEARRTTLLMLSLHPGVEVIATAADGRQALELARAYKPDIVIVDINMPFMDGISAIRAMREYLAITVYIVISAEKDSQTLSAAAAAGANEYLIKPFTDEEMEAAIRRSALLWLDNRQRAAQSVSPAEAEKAQLRRQAHIYAQARRIDNQAVRVYEKLAADPSCELQWLTALGMAYLQRKEWNKLKAFAAYMERKT